MKIIQATINRTFGRISIEIWRSNKHQNYKTRYYPNATKSSLNRIKRAFKKSASYPNWTTYYN